MKDKSIFAGVGVALITPMLPNGSVDFAALARVIDRVIDGGVDYLLALGTTSETPTLQPSERIAVARFIKERTRGRVALMLGVGGNCTRDVIEQLRTIDTSGYSAILSVNPYYNKPNQEGLFRHFSAIAEASPLPIVLYNIPGRTGVNMNPETVVRLATAHDNIIGIKEASGNIEQMRQICTNAPKGFMLISGDDGLTVEAIRCGGVGVLSVLGHLYPSQIKAVANAATEGRFDEADELMNKLLPIIDSLFEEGNPVGVKNALAIKGICGNTVRLPLAEASQSLNAKQIKLIEEYEKSTI
ncbi:MAG: 4-hydroxy-tetrahydrodipicolinate synthase [Alistipes sp.]|nr:4-hydroxy-tetrahydrodipicolinate synthase [Alistipes sp.]